MQISLAGLSDDILLSNFGDEGASYGIVKGADYSSEACEGLEKEGLHDIESTPNFISDESEAVDNGHQTTPLEGSGDIENEEPDVELNSLFSEEASACETLPPEVLKYQKKKKFAQPSGGHILEKIDGIWKKVTPSTNTCE